MKLYVSPISSNARRARMAAIALGLEPELIVVDVMTGEQKTADYLALNPNGKVPTLVDGDVVLWESLAIMTYLADQTPGQQLYPTGPAARAQVNKWLFWAACHWGQAVGVLIFERVMKRRFGQGEPDAYTVKRFGGLLDDHAKVLDTRLASSRYVAADHLTLADLAIAAPLMWEQPAALPVRERANLARWLSEIQALEAWRATEP